MPLSLSQAFAINSGNIATGFSDVAGGATHATLWDRAGVLTDLGTLGGESAWSSAILPTAAACAPCAGRAWPCRST